MTATTMTTQDLVDYANELIAAGYADQVEADHGCAYTLATYVRDGLIEADGITAEGRQHLMDLYDEYEG